MLTLDMAHNPCCLPSSTFRFNQISDNYDKIIFSVPSEENVFVRFVNDTDRRVTILWLDFNGKRKCYAHDITRGQFLDVNTFANHAWIFEDSETGDQLIGNNEKVFRARGGLSLERNSIIVTIPVYSLRQRALQVVRDGLQLPEHFLQLGLPSTVLVDLFKLISKQQLVKKGIY